MRGMYINTSLQNFVTKMEERKDYSCEEYSHMMKQSYDALRLKNFEEKHFSDEQNAYLTEWSDSFSFENIPESFEEKLFSDSEMEILKNTVVGAKIQFMKDADIKIVNGKRVFANRDSDELFDLLANTTSDVTLETDKFSLIFVDEKVHPLVMKWLLKKRNSYVLWMVEELINAGRMEGDYDTYEYVLGYCIKYGTFDIFLAACYILYNCGREDVANLINENWDVLMIFACQYVNFEVFLCIEKMFCQYLHQRDKKNGSVALYDSTKSDKPHFSSNMRMYSKKLETFAVDYDFALTCVCMTKRIATNLEMLEYIVSRLSENVMMINPVQLMHNECWETLKQLRLLSLKYGKWNITDEQICSRMYAAVKKEQHKHIADAMGHSLKLDGHIYNGNVLVV